MTGIPARYESGASGFSEACRVDRGTLAIDPACRISTMFHEAGHLAITPRRFRPWMHGNLHAGQRKMLETVDEAGLHPNDPLCRAVIPCSDPEATMRAWTAGVALGLPSEEIVRDDECGGEGEAVRLLLQMRACIGVYGLVHDAASCEIRARNGTAAAWPHLHCWTQELGSADEAGAIATISAVLQAGVS
ncbi:hypothetical protein [Paraburkholderia oxyphila]|uniref:hypothetical protein n=1 Tax=Paraburkholderia oxyphila TaxID=614212 RepID=UPI0012EE76E1|nr:hypothetical protein [Paraburkholderia oxyphila]